MTGLRGRRRCRFPAVTELGEDGKRLFACFPTPRAVSRIIRVWRYDVEDVAEKLLA